MTGNRKLPNIVFMDAYCTSHVGNDVLLDSSYRLVKAIYPHASVRVHAKNPEGFRQSHGLHCGRRLFAGPPKGRLRKHLWYVHEVLFILLQILNSKTLRLPPSYLASGARKKAITDFLQCDVAVTISGEMISDTFWKMLPLHLHMYWLAKQCGARVVICPQSIGPLRMRWTRALAHHVLSKCDIVTGRDELSMAELRSLDITGANVLHSPDVGVGQPTGSEEQARAFLKQLGVDTADGRRWVGVTCSAGSPEAGIRRTDHVRALVDALGMLAKEQPIGVLLMPANMPVLGESHADYDASGALYDQLRTQAVHALICPPQVIPARLFKATARLLDVFISTRMHAAILSTMAPVPTITLNTQRKLLGYMALVGQHEYSINLEDLGSHILTSKVRLALENADLVKERLTAAREDRLRALNAYGEQIKELLALEVASDF